MNEERKPVEIPRDSRDYLTVGRTEAIVDPYAEPPRRKVVFDMKKMAEEIKALREENKRLKVTVCRSLNLLAEVDGDERNSTCYDDPSECHPDCPHRGECGAYQEARK